MVRFILPRAFELGGLCPTFCIANPCLQVPCIFWHCLIAFLLLIMMDWGCHVHHIYVSVDLFSIVTIIFIYLLHQMQACDFYSCWLFEWTATSAVLLQIISVGRHFIHSSVTTWRHWHFYFLVLTKLTCKLVDEQPKLPYCFRYQFAVMPGITQDSTGIGPVSFPLIIISSNIVA